MNREKIMHVTVTVLETVANLNLSPEEAKEVFLNAAATTPSISHFKSPSLEPMTLSEIKLIQERLKTNLLELEIKEKEAALKGFSV